MELMLENLIYDRTDADLAEYEYLSNIPLEDMNEEQRTKWLEGLKGAYNYIDINRVNGAVEYLQKKLSENGYNAIIDIEDELNVESIPDTTYFQTYLDNVHRIRNAFSLDIDNSNVPTNIEDIFTIKGANAIEKLLVDIEDLMIKTIAMFRPCGTFASGGMEGLI